MQIERVLQRIAQASTPQRPVHLVGGAVRDRLLGRASHDLDFVLPGETLPLARQLADQLHGALYVLDELRDTTRVLIDDENGSRLVLDFASLRSGDLDGDLHARDFSVNAMALDAAHPDTLIDPCGGLADLREKRLRACSRLSLSDDPVRVMRGVRLALSLGFQIEHDTKEWMRSAAGLLPKISAERLRDELFKMMEGHQVALAIRLLDQLDALEHILPELELLKTAQQGPPHVHDVWEHTLEVVQHLEALLDLLTHDFHEESASGLILASASGWLGRYRTQLSDHFNQQMIVDRSYRGLIFLAALYHDSGKPACRTVEPDGKVRFLGHDRESMRILGQRARALALSNDEVQRLTLVAAEHMRVHFLAKQPNLPAPRTIYRFFRDTGEAGVDVCLLSLADCWGTFSHTLPQDIWMAELRTCRALLEARWERTETAVNPPRLVSGNDLITELGMRPGKAIGQALEAVREAQVEGHLQTRQDALQFIQTWLEQSVRPPSTG